MISRLHFALADLRNEIKAITGSEDDPEIILKLRQDVFDKVIGELSNAMGQVLVPGPGGLMFNGVSLVPIAMPDATEEETHG